VWDRLDEELPQAANESHATSPFASTATRVRLGPTAVSDTNPYFRCRLSVREAVDRGSQVRLALVGIRARGTTHLVDVAHPRNIIPPIAAGTTEMHLVAVDGWPPEL